MFWTPASAGVTTHRTFYEFIKLKGILSFEVRAGAEGQPGASKNHKALVLPGDGAGAKAFRLSLRKPDGFHR